MKKMICSRCKKRPAVIFISKIVDGKTVPEGLCINCAMEMNIGPIKQMMEQMGITEEEAFLAARRLATTEGVLAGISSGAALAAATKLAERPENKGACIVVILPDGGDRYLSTKLFE